MLATLLESMCMMLASMLRYIDYILRLAVLDIDLVIVHACQMAFAALLHDSLLLCC